MDLILNHWLENYGFNESSLDAKNRAGEYALVLACRQGRDDVVQALLARGESINCIDNYGNNALWGACYAESETCCLLLLQHKAELLNYQNPSGNTALSYAASSGKDKLVHLLLQLGADPGLQNLDGMTALDLVTTRTSLKLLRAANATKL